MFDMAAIAFILHLLVFTIGDVLHIALSGTWDDEGLPPLGQGERAHAVGVAPLVDILARHLLHNDLPPGVGDDPTEREKSESFHYQDLNRMQQEKPINLVYENLKLHYVLFLLQLFTPLKQKS